MSNSDFDLYVHRDNGWYECKIISAFKIQYRKSKRKIKWDYSPIHPTGSKDYR